MTERKPFLAGNWKMHLTRAEATELAKGLAERVGDDTTRDVAIFPPLTALAAVREALRGSPIRVGAQTCHPETHGAFTGEVSAEMLADAGSELVLVGHSERRHVFGETDETVAAQLRAVLRAGLAPILCVGETIEERKANRTTEVVQRQLVTALDGLLPDDLGELVLAYEPVWAIGTGLTASPAQAQEVHADLRGLLPPELAGSTRIQYGGSVKPDNIASLMREPDVDGALVGGASLNLESFAAIACYSRG